MSLAQLLNRPCTITQRAPSASTDQAGNEVPGEVEIETVCELQQRRRDEADDQSEVSDTDWLLILPAGTDIRTGDSVVADGITYEMVGDPWHARNPRTQAESHLECSLRKTGGSEDAS